MQSLTTRSNPAHAKGVRSVGVLELSKGIFVLLAGFGFLTLEKCGFEMQDVASSLLYILHISPHRHLSMVFLRAAERVDDMNILMVAIAAAAYSALRFIEGYGLLRQRIWAEWFALVSGLIYIPLEVYELLRRATVIRWTVFLINVAMVLYMSYVRFGNQPSTTETASATSNS